LETVTITPSLDHLSLMAFAIAAVLCGVIAIGLLAAF
jgi:hypothetical protein